MGFDLSPLDIFLALLVVIVIPYITFVLLLVLLYNKKFKGSKKAKRIIIAIALAPLLYPVIDSIKPVSEIISF